MLRYLMDKASAIDKGFVNSENTNQANRTRREVTHHTDRGTKCMGRDVITELCPDDTRVAMGACYTPEERR